jgi:hypothetical protein
MSDTDYTYIHHEHPHPVLNLCAAITFICASYMYTALRRPTAPEWRTRLGDIGQKGLSVELAVRSLVDRPVSPTDLAYVRGQVDALIFDLRTVYIYPDKGEAKRIGDAAAGAWKWFAEQQSAAATSDENDAAEIASTE